MHFQPPRKTLLGLFAQLCCFVRGRFRTDGEARQDRLARRRTERTALCDFDGGGQRFRNVRKQHRHFRAGLEAVIGRQLLAIGLCHQPPAGDAKQRVVGFVIVGRRKIRLVGRNQRQAFAIGQIDQAGFDAALAVDAVPLQFNVEAVTEQRRQAFAPACRERGLIGLDRKRDRSVRPAR